MRSYPADYRAERGEDIVATASELSDGQWSFRQARSLFVAGFRARARLATDYEPRNAWGQAIVTAFGLMMVGSVVISAAPLLGVQDRGGVIIVHPSLRFLLVGSLLTLGCATMRLRWWIIAPFTLVALSGPVLDSRSAGGHGLELGSSIAHVVLVCAALVWATTCTNTRRAFSPAFATALVLYGIGGAVVFPSLTVAWLHLPTTLLPLVGGLLFAFVEPRLLMVGTMFLVWSASTQLPQLVMDNSDGRLLGLIIVGTELAVTATLCVVSHLVMRRIFRPA